MFQGVRPGWLLALGFAAYICLDFSSPFVAGAFEFAADQSVDGIVMKAFGARVRDGLPVSMPDVVRVVEVSLTFGPSPQPRGVPSPEWVVVLREAHSSSSARSSLVEAH